MWLIHGLLQCLHSFLIATSFDNGNTNEHTYFFLLQEKLTSNEVRELAMSGEHPFPYLIMEESLETSSNQFHLTAEKQIICSLTSSLLEATLGLLGSHYVFMFKYPACTSNLYLYLQKCALQITDGRNVSYHPLS